jgi:hypothetical protein
MGKSVSTNVAGIETNYGVISGDNCILTRISHTPKTKLARREKNPNVQRRLREGLPMEIIQNLLACLGIQK